MSARGAARGRIARLEAFVRAWDEFIGVSQQANTMNPADSEYPHVRERVGAKQDEVQRARRAVGLLT